jgi:glycosyltransferase involved in cell wall biosynthesis
VNKSLKSSSNFDGIICFAGEDWWYHNRGHYDMQVMRRFAQRTKVLFVNSVISKPLQFKKGNRLFTKIRSKLQSIFKGIKEVEPNFFVYTPISIPLYQFSWGKALNDFVLKMQIKYYASKLRMKYPLVWVECLTACNTALALHSPLRIYQRTDIHEEFKGADSYLVDCNLTLMNQAEIVVYVNRMLYERERTKCCKAILSDHGVDYDLFVSQSNEKENLFDMKEISSPVVGYFGSLSDHTMDFGFLLEVIKLLPDVSFVLVGPAKSDVSRFRNLPNTYLLGQKNYQDIPLYGNCFDVSIMIWRNTRWIEACNPVKLKEYLAIGRPVVTTPFPQLKEYADLVYVAEDPVSFAQAIRQALQENDPKKNLNRRNAVASSTWDQIADNLWNEIALGFKMEV